MFAALLALSLCHAAPDVRAIFAAGLQAANAGELQRAAGYFSRATELSPQWALPYLEGGAAQLALGDAAQARPLLQQAVALAPDNPRAFFVLGQACSALGDGPAAVTALQRAAALRPGWVAAWTALAEVADDDPPQAVAALEAARRLDPANAAILVSLAALYERQDNLPAAEACWLTLLHNNPAVPYIAYQLGHFYERHGDTAKAKRAFARAAALDPRPNRKMRPLK